MNWKLLFRLSLFGIGMGLATVFFIPTKVEPFFWLVIFIICAYFIAKKANGKYFLHGFFLSLINSFWITSCHILMYNSYIANHPEMTNMNAQMHMVNHPRLLMALFGPVFGACFGLIMGLFAFIASKLVK